MHPLLENFLVDLVLFQGKVFFLVESGEERMVSLVKIVKAYHVELRLAAVDFLSAQRALRRVLVRLLEREDGFLPLH